MQQNQNTTSTTQSHRVDSPTTDRINPGGHESYSLQGLDRLFRSFLAQSTLGLSPATLTHIYTDWAMHLAMSPGKQIALSTGAVQGVAELQLQVLKTLLDNKTAPGRTPGPQDHRFDDPAWSKWPFNLISQSFLGWEEWWEQATSNIEGVSYKNQEAINFITRQWVDRFSPSNFLMTNPVVLNKTVADNGMNLAQGARNLAEDIIHRLTHEKPGEADSFVVGKDVAATPGKVVYRNELMELIQYAPQTDSVYTQPVLIVSAWIMKYYILDLSAQNSMVDYLLKQGHSVFVMSWKNPTANDRDLSLEDYRKKGIMQVLDQINAVVPEQKIHTVGYCLGGTLLSIAAATMARDNDDRLASMTLFAAQTDFTEAGELKMFIRHSQLNFLEALMWDKGYLDTHQMAGAFQVLHSNDLIWSKIVQEHLLGERPVFNDLMAWNADLTRMPYTMHSQYLRWLFMENRLATGHYQVDDKPIALSDIRVPIFCVGTETDHVAPWKSVYKIKLLTDTDVTFVLTSGGHNAGIVSEPGHKHRHYRQHLLKKDDQYVDPETWHDTTPVNEGSWWPAWHTWLAQSDTQGKPPPMGLNASSADLMDAPGEYVMQR